MDNELINLLPADRQHALSREYFFRFGTVIAWTLSLLVCVSGLLLLPTYLLLSHSATAKQENLDHIESVLSTANEKALSARLATLSANATALTVLGDAPSAIATVRQALAVSRPGITVLGFAYTPAADKTPGTFAISGSAATRDSLRSYQLALQAASFAVAANLPVSAFAQDANIPFTITVTLKL